MNFLKKNKLVLFIFLLFFGVSCSYLLINRENKNNYIIGHNGTITITKKLFLKMINGENLNESVEIDLTRIYPYLKGELINSYWDGENILMLTREGKGGDSTKWYFTIIYPNQKLKSVLLDTRRQFNIDQIFCDDENITIIANEKAYLINLHNNTDSTNEDVEVRSKYNVVNGKTVNMIFDNTIENTYNASSLKINKVDHKIEGILSRPIQLVGVVGNYALVQIVPVTSNPDQLSWSVIYEHIKYDIDTNTFAVLFFDLSNLTFEDTNLSSTNTTGTYLKINYTYPSFDKHKIEELNNYIQNFP